MIAFSVVVPVFNVERYLGECLDSLLGQSFGDFEVICVNDGSTDSSRQILAEFAQGDPRVRIIDRVNGGLSAARNTGLDAATGKYAYFLDSDDALKPDALSQIHSLMEAKRLDYLAFSTDVFFDDPAADTPVERERAESYYAPPSGLTGRVMSGRDLMLAQFGESYHCVTVQLRAFRRGSLDSRTCRFPEGLIHEDNYFTPVALLLASRAMLISDRLYRRRVRAGSIMTASGAERRHAEGYAGVIRRLNEVLAVKDPALLSDPHMRGFMALLEGERQRHLASVERNAGSVLYSWLKRSLRSVFPCGSNRR